MTTETAIPKLLRDLWRQRARLLASNVATDGREHREIAHATSLIRQDYHDRFLVELLQNANDQALLGGVRDSTVVVVRSERFLAVSNGGQPVTARNLERLSSLADSDKPGTLVGNKGVGFKAVYQVTDAPEIYSVASGAPAGILENFGVGLALAQHPFEDASLVAAVEQDVRTFFEENAGLAQALSARGHTDPLDAVRPEFGRVAGFKFPLARGRDDLAARLADLSIPEPDQAQMCTLVVLPLKDERAAGDAGRAVDELVGSDGTEPGQAELAVLFLAGIGRLIVIDHVRGLRWAFSCSVTPTAADAPVCVATVSAVVRADAESTRRFWLMQRDVLACAAPVAAQRMDLIEGALRDFGLEGWAANDPLPVTVALPMPLAGSSGSLGPAGRFCLGLPTQQPTGLPAHVDARFFGTISRTGLDFALPYNELLLCVAAEVFGDLLAQLRLSSKVDERRAATLALQRTPGALGERVFAPGGVAGGEVVLAWGAERFVRRSDCQLPGPAERTLLPFLCDSLAEQPDLVGELPEEQLLMAAAPVLESMELPPLQLTPHPWLGRQPGSLTTVEAAAREHRHDGPDYWEPFVAALLGCFDARDLQDQSWLPVGAVELAAPSQRVFLPAPDDIKGDDEDVADVPPRVAAMIRLLDSSAMGLREDGRTLTKLASRLEEARLVRRPRKAELLEDALFPALEAAIQAEGDVALELFGQAVSWIASMREQSRGHLNCRQAYVPVALPMSSSGFSWTSARRSYLGQGWGLTIEHERLLGAAYPGRCLLPFDVLSEKLGWAAEDGAAYRAAVEAMGVSAVPRVTELGNRRRPPLESYYGRLLVVGTPELGHPPLEPIYGQYVRFLSGYSTQWSYGFQHDVHQVYWVDGLEHAERRQPILDLILMHPDEFLKKATVPLGRRGFSALHDVPSMWAFALANLDWPVFPAQYGIARAPVRLPADLVWRVPEGARRAAYAQVLAVVPGTLSGASRLLGALGVHSMDDAPLARLFDGLTDLACRLDPELLSTRREALSAASEFYSRVEDRLRAESLDRVPPGFRLPLLRGRRLEAVDPSDESVVIAFDDEPARARHVVGMDKVFRVPFTRDAAVDRIHSLFARSWGTERVIRTSNAKIQLEFTAAPGSGEGFLDWLRREFPHSEVAAELAALLTLAGERAVRAERVSRSWGGFERLRIVFGVFRDSGISSFYDRPSDELWVASALEKHDVISATWELAGARSRDLWAVYARALREGNSRSFLSEREIGDVEIVEVADAAGLHRLSGLEGLAPALLAARCHLVPGTTLDDAAAWLAPVVGARTEDVASDLGRPDLAPILTAALGMHSPEGELQVVRHLGVPWQLWQEAVVRRDGQRYVFVESVLRYKSVRDHLVSVVREVGAREASTDLQSLSAGLAALLAAPLPESVQFLPPEAADAEATAWRGVRSALSAFDRIARALGELPPPPWNVELPVPKDATRRGARLFREVDPSQREIEAATSVQAVVEVATRLAAALGEKVDAAAVLADKSLSTRVQGEWAHVHAALLVLRALLEAGAPQTVKRLSSVQAFRDPSTLGSLMAALPELRRDEPETPQPMQRVLGVELTAAQLKGDLASGRAGALGAKLAAAAANALSPLVLNSERDPLPAPGSGGQGGSGWGAGGASSARARREGEMVGDIGEALVHEWLSVVLSADYGPDCWVSRARERYGLPPCGNDGLGYDFRVPDLGGRLFGKPAPTFLIEVKSTSTDGTGPFPMSRAEWDRARECHEAGQDTVYVILRVFEADSQPRIGDVILDPFAAHRRGEIRLAERDLWVAVAPRRQGDASSP